MQTDYLVIGSGAVGMAFADTLLDESDAHITIVDRHDQPGGHWNDAYPFVTLHQPSAFYGLNSRELGSGYKDQSGPNRGFYELASGAEVRTYFDQAMRQKFLPSGRVSYHPMSRWTGDGGIVSLLSGARTEVSVRKKIVDATRFSPTVPSTHTPQFSVDAGVRVMPPNDLPRFVAADAAPAGAHRFCILGAGKTAIDAILWLLRNGAQPEVIQWVMPRDAWLQNRLQTQPGLEFFNDSIGGEADRLEAFAQARDANDLFLRLEQLGQMLRIDPSRIPTMYHYATISLDELAMLRTISGIIRMGRIRRIAPDGMLLEQGKVSMDPGAVYVDCTASALRYDASEPVFQDARIVIQLLRAPLVTLSAALTAYVEVHGGDDGRKNQLCAPVPFPNDLQAFVRTTQVGMINQGQWAYDKSLRQWMRHSRLDIFGKMVAELDPEDGPRQAIVARLRGNVMPAMANMQNLLKPVTR